MKGPGAPDEETRYLTLLHRVLAKQHPDLPDVVYSAYANKESLSLDTLQFIRDKHIEMVELKKQLGQADKDYDTLLAQLRSRPTPEPTIEDSRTRVLDFMWGLMSSLERDFSKFPDLQLLANELYREGNDRK